MKKKRLSRISAMHFIKLIYRSVLFLTLLTAYILYRVRGGELSLAALEKRPWILIAIWIVYMGEMMLRLFPSDWESMGCQKQFARNFHPAAKQEPALLKAGTAWWIAVGWIGFNLVLCLPYLLGWIDGTYLLLLSAAFGVCDIICILFFCPFQTWFMKNRCCGTCRIYNWDFAMMFTPLILLPSLFTWSLLAMALVLLIRWEYTVYRYPERFCEQTNSSLSCAECKEKLCHHKTQLHSFWKKNKGRLNPAEVIRFRNKKK